MWEPNKGKVLASLDASSVVSLVSVQEAVDGKTMVFASPRKNGIAECWEWADRQLTKQSEQRFGIAMAGVNSQVDDLMASKGKDFFDPQPDASCLLSIVGS